MAADYIRLLIFGGVLRTGDRISLDEVAGLLGVSRQPVREAMRELTGDDLVVVEPKRGTFVGRFDEDVVTEHFELFGLIAARAARRATARRDESMLRRLSDIHSRAEAAPDAATLTRLSIEFQNVLTVAAGSPRLTTLLRSMNRFVPGEYYLENIPVAARLASDTRAGIIDALERGDAEAASQLTQHQWSAGGQLLVEHLRSIGVFRSPEP